MVIGPVNLCGEVSGRNGEEMRKKWRSKTYQSIVRSGLFMSILRYAEEHKDKYL